MELGNQHADVGRTYIVRPAFVVRKDMWSVTHAVVSAGGMLPTLKADELAAAMVNIAIDGGERQIWENKALVTSGKEILSRAA